MGNCKSNLRIPVSMFFDIFQFLKKFFFWGKIQIKKTK